MPLSRRTLAALMRAAAELGHAPLGIVFYEFGVEGRDAGGNLLNRARSLVAAVNAEDDDPDDVSRRLIELCERVLGSFNDWQLEHNEVLHELRRILEIDGLLYEEGRLIPTTPEAAALGPQLSLLEQELETRGYAVALAHYRQAVNNFAQGNHEAANGQLRSALEDLLIQLASEGQGADPDNPGAALQRLRDTGFLSQTEWNHFRYLWGDIQDNGPHRGLTTDQEALFRLHAVTAAARYLVTKEQP